MTRRHLDDSSVVDRGLYWIPTVVVAVSGNVGIDRRWRQETSPTTPMKSCRASRTLLPTVGEQLGRDRDLGGIGSKAPKDRQRRRRSNPKTENSSLGSFLIRVREARPSSPSRRAGGRLEINLFSSLSRRAS